jgi:hypothetical protein
MDHLGPAEGLEQCPQVEVEGNAVGAGPAEVGEEKPEIAGKREIEPVPLVVHGDLFAQPAQTKERAEHQAGPQDQPAHPTRRAGNLALFVEALHFLTNIELPYQESGFLFLRSAVLGASGSKSVAISLNPWASSHGRISA